MKTKRGFRHLLLDDYTYGELSTHEHKTTWRCTRSIKDQRTKKFRKCTAKLHTRVINGYEMIQCTAVDHKHPKIYKPMPVQEIFVP